MTIKTATSPAFEALLGDLTTLAKATDVNQERIAAGRSAEGHMQHGDTLAKSEEEKKREKEKEEREEEEKREREKNAHGGKGEHKGKEKEKGEHHMAKSFSLKTDAGEMIEVVDASELLKGLSVRLDDTTNNVLVSLQSVTEVIKGQSTLVKSLMDRLEGQDKLLADQGTLIKSLQTDLTKIGTEPSGRRSVLTVAERTTAHATETMAKAGMPEGVTTDQFFTKALDMQRNGQLLGTDIALAETCLNSGIPIPQPLLTRVLGQSGSGRH